MADAAGGRRDACLASLEPRDDAVELIVVSPDRAPQGALVPELWAIGIGEARGDVVAITTSHFTVDPSWIRAIREAHARLLAPAIGGPILPPPAPSLLADATYFLRYSAYLPGGPERRVTDLAGDNASYKRTALQGYPLARGFWEHELHETLQSRGESLVFAPSIRVTQISSFGFLPFMRQRFQHGCRFGSTRATAFGVARRIAYALALPLVFAILLRRILGRALPHRDLRGRLLACLPILCCFLLAWAVGEALGHLLPVRRDSR